MYLGSTLEHFLIYANNYVATYEHFLIWMKDFPATHVHVMYNR